MELTGILGGVLGLVGGIANGFVEIKKHRMETERLRAQWEHEREFAKIQSDIETEKGAATAFAASQTAAGNEDGLQLPNNATRGQVWWALVTQSLRTATRPLLTWTLVFGALYNPPVMADPAAMAVGWWFGTRTSTKFFTK